MQHSRKQSEVQHSWKQGKCNTPGSRGATLLEAEGGATLLEAGAVQHSWKQWKCNTPGSRGVLHPRKQRCNTPGSRGSATLQEAGKCYTPGSRGSATLQEAGGKWRKTRNTVTNSHVSFVTCINMTLTAWQIPLPMPSLGEKASLIYSFHLSVAARTTGQSVTLQPLTMICECLRYLSRNFEHGISKCHRI